MTSLVDRLASVVGGSHVLTEPGLTASYEVDWTGRFRGRAAAVVRPGSCDEVAAVVRECAAAGVPIIPQGGNTGLVGASVPAADSAAAVVLSLRRLSWMDPVDEAAGQVTVGAGATIGAVASHARTAGWDFGLDFAARDSATVGGALATNAGGERVLRYGSARAQVLDVEAVLADGTVLRRPTGGVVKDSAGYDLSAVLVGSEGTLAVVTAARLRLVPFLPSRVVAVVGVADTAAAQGVLSVVRRRVEGLTAGELFHSDGLALVSAHTGLPPPFPTSYPTYLLLECAGSGDPLDALAAAVDGVPEVADVAVATDASGRAALWRYREAHTESINAAGVPVKLDVALPPAALPAAEAAIRAAAAAAAPGARIILFGHLAEANLHVNVLDATTSAEPVTDAVLTTVAAHGGSISAEHGIGRAKARWLPLTRSPAEIATMRMIKSALDPRGLLNPGVLFPPTG